MEVPKVIECIRALNETRNVLVITNLNAIDTKYNVTCIVFQPGLGFTFPVSTMKNMTLARERGKEGTQVWHFVASS